MAGPFDRTTIRPTSDSDLKRAGRRRSRLRPRASAPAERSRGARPTSRSAASPSPDRSTSRNWRCSAWRSGPWRYRPVTAWYRSAWRSMMPWIIAANVMRVLLPESWTSARWKRRAAARKATRSWIDASSASTIRSRSVDVGRVPPGGDEPSGRWFDGRAGSVHLVEGDAVELEVGPGSLGQHAGRRRVHPGAAP